MIEEIDFDLFGLALGCAQRGLHLSALLKDGITEEAKFLTRNGFLVPAPDALTHAAGVFASVDDMVESTPLRFEKAKHRLDQICAFGTALNGIARDYDMAWSMLWAHAIGEGMPTVEQAADGVLTDIWNQHFAGPKNNRRIGIAAKMVLNEFNAGFEAELLAKMECALREACDYEGVTR